MEFSISRRVGTKQNDSFYITSFSAFSNLFRVEMMPQRYFLIFWIFFAIFLKFSLTRTVGTERNGMKIFIFSLSHPFPTYFRLKWNHNGIFYFFWIFLLFFFEFTITRRVGKERTVNFYFFTFSAFSNLFWLEMKP